MKARGSTLPLISALVEGVGVQREAPADLTGKDPVPIAQKNECVLGTVSTGVGNLTSPSSR